MIGLIITGTDTGVGKTFIAVEIIRALRSQGVRVGAYKPVVSGAIDGAAGPIWEDVEKLAAALDQTAPIDRISPQRFLAPLAPPVAAQLEGKSVDPFLMRRGLEWWQDRADLLVIEGAGGLLSPLTATETLADWAAELNWPLIVVARRGLGTINHTLLTLEAAAARNLAVAGVVMNETVPSDADDLAIMTNAAEIKRRCTVPILAIRTFSAAQDLRPDSPLLTINWYELARGGRPPLDRRLKS